MKTGHRVVGVILSPVFASLAGVWFLCGSVLSLPAPLAVLGGGALSAAAFAATGAALSVQRYAFTTSLVDVFVATVGASAAVAGACLCAPPAAVDALPRPGGLLSVSYRPAVAALGTLLFSANLGLALAKAAAFSGDSGGLVTLFLFCCSATSIAGVVTLRRSWNRATPEGLLRAEQALYAAHVRSVGELELAVYAGVGTAFLPCQDKRVAHPPALVLLHGYAAGSGFWCMNLDALAQCFDVYAVDWLGCGRSERPAFTAGADEAGPGGGAEESLARALDRWRERVGLDHFVLCGHSLGAMLSVTYAHLFSERVRHLVLVSPVGVPPPRPPRPEGYPWPWRILRALWARGLTPMAAIRFLGPLGQWAMAKVRPRPSPVPTCFR